MLGLRTRGPAKLWRISWSGAEGKYETAGCKLYSDESYMQKAVEALRKRGARIHIETTETNWKVMNETKAGVSG